MVEEMIDKATLALTERRYELVAQAVASDPFVDEHEVHVEEECLKLLALHQPVAIDLRRITTVMKISAELERVADLGRRHARHLRDADGAGADGGRARGAAPAKRSAAEAAARHRR